MNDDDADEAAWPRRYPLSGLFHANTARFAHNAEPPAAEVWPSPAREDASLALAPLPPPLPLAVPLGQLLRERCSCRHFTAAALSLEVLSTLLRAAYGVCREEQYGRLRFATRSVPSGGGLYPLEVQLVCRRAEGLAPGLYHYVPALHALECVRQAELPDAYLSYLFMGQEALARAPLLVLISAEFDRSLKKYGDRGYRYTLLEAGHAMQNLNLAATALALGSCNMGGFFDEELGGVMGLPLQREALLYACAIGHPAHGQRQQMRDL